MKKIVLALTLGLSMTAVSSAYADAVADGKALFEAKGCAACHSTEAGGVSPGPNLVGVKARRDRAGIVTQIVTPQNKPDNAVMMPAGLATKEEAEKLADYLTTL